MIYTGNLPKRRIRMTRPLALAIRFQATRDMHFNSRSGEYRSPAPLQLIHRDPITRSIWKVR